MKQRSRKKYFLMGLILLLIIAISFSILCAHYRMGNVMVTSVSSDGHYALTTDDKNIAVLWDLRAHNKKIISRDANMYSAYWVKNTPYYLWQNLKTTGTKYLPQFF